MHHTILVCSDKAVNTDDDAVPDLTSSDESDADDDDVTDSDAAAENEVRDCFCLVASAAPALVIVSCCC